VAIEAAVSRSTGLEDDLSAILGLRTAEGGADPRRHRRNRLPLLAAGLLIVGGGAAFLTVGQRPHIGGSDREDAATGARDGELATRPELPSSAPVVAEEENPRIVAVEDAAPVPSPGGPGSAAPRNDTTVTADRGSVPGAGSAIPPGAPVRAAAGPAAASPGDMPQPLQSAVAASRPVAPAVPASEPGDEARPARSAPPEREQIAAADPAVADQSAPATDDAAERSARRRSERQKERKVIDSLDAIRMLRRQ
jgi:hypothetical protein